MGPEINRLRDVMFFIDGPKCRDEKWNEEKTLAPDVEERVLERVGESWET